MSTVAGVHLWGRRIGAVSLEDGQTYAAFQYEPEFVASRIQVSPIVMKLSERIYEFPNLAWNSFHGLPGLLADSLPDKFGNALIDAWLARQGRTPQSFNAVERLLYTGARGMGALEFKPANALGGRTSQPIRIDRLVELASEILNHCSTIKASFTKGEATAALKNILAVGTSAGGARAKAVIAWNKESNEVRSGQVPAGPGFQYWLIKFDGVVGNRDKDLDDPNGFGTIEYGYYNMARAAGITMSECRLLEENGRRHFMAKRFDRLDDGEKLHMQSLAALAHYDFNQGGAYSYEQAMLVIRQLGLPMASVEEQFRRMVFNIVARNQDDHVKNIAFLMDKSGRWALSPAFDVTYSFNPSGVWTAQHQMTMNGKRDGFTRHDFSKFANAVGMKRGRDKAILDDVLSAVSRWSRYSEEAGVARTQREQIATAHRLDIAAS